MHYFDRNISNSAKDYWPRTATLDWCEENYVVCHNIAEFWNSFTNLTFLLLAAYGAYMVIRQKFELRYLMAYLTMGFVGVGSFLFHATLTYEMQLLDELPMIYCVCVVIFCIFRAEKKPRYGRPLKIFLILDAILITLIYLVNKNTLFFQVSYGLHILVIVLRGSQLFHRLPNSHGKKQLKSLFLFGYIAHASAFLLWNVDNHFCGKLRSLREQFGILAPMLQLHAWWHVLTGIGSYVYIVGNQYMRILLLEMEEEFELKWKLGVIPMIKRVEERMKQT